MIRLTGVSEEEVQSVCAEELAKIERRRERYLGTRKRVDLAGRVAIVIDDGIATGATTRAAVPTTKSACVSIGAPIFPSCSPPVSSTNPLLSRGGTAAPCAWSHSPCQRPALGQFRSMEIQARPWGVVDRDAVDDDAHDRIGSFARVCGVRTIW